MPKKCREIYMDTMVGPNSTFLNPSFHLTWLMRGRHFEPEVSV